jgi:prolyl oligopeptidase PreP (S9A serine peptidase family)
MSAGAASRRSKLNRLTRSDCYMRLRLLRVLVCFSIAVDLGSICARLPAYALNSAMPSNDDWLDGFRPGERATQWIANERSRLFGELARTGTFAELTKRLTLLADSRVATNTRSLEVRGEWVYELLKPGEKSDVQWRRARLTTFLSGKPSWQVLARNDPSRAYSNVVISDVVCLGETLVRCVAQQIDAEGGSSSSRLVTVDPGGNVRWGPALPANSLGIWQDATHVLFAVLPRSRSTHDAIPAYVKRWNVGAPLATAATIFTAQPTDRAVMLSTFRADQGPIPILSVVGADGQSVMLYRVLPRVEALNLPPGVTPVGFVNNRLIGFRQSSGQDGGATSDLFTFSDDMRSSGPSIFKTGPGEFITRARIVGRAILLTTLNRGEPGLYVCRSISGVWKTTRIQLPPRGVNRHCYFQRRQ